MHPLEQQVCKWMSGPELRSVFTGQTIIIGCSTGPDSMALLHILHGIAEKLSLTLIPTYIDHGLRPTEVVQERELLIQVAARLGRTYEIRKVDVTGVVEQEKKSIEHAARELRYRALSEVKKHYGASLIAVGHNADDQAEEVLLRLLRGSSRKALSGMQRLGNGIVRPLLNFSKQQIYSYLDDRHITYCYDSSNADPTFLRNRVRHDLLPYLEEHYDAGIRNALLKTASNLQQDEAYLAQQVDDLEEKVVVKRTGAAEGKSELILDRIQLKQYHQALQRRCIEKMLWEMGSPARYEHILAILHALNEPKSGQELHLTRGLRVNFSRQWIVFSYPRGRTVWRGSLARKKE